MAGGSGLYINAVCSGFDPLPVADKELREELSEVYRDVGIETLQARLKKLDPEYYNKVDIKNPHRLIRAIEVCIKSGKKYSELRSDSKVQRKFTTIKIGLELGRAELYERINKRVDEMMKAGLLEEVKKLAEYKHRNSMHTVGYKELFDYIEGKTDRNRAVELIKQNTRNFAKRQMTWFRIDKSINWFNPADREKILAFIMEKLKSR
jgi:tRNA dimethylallyltransferase